MTGMTRAMARRLSTARMRHQQREHIITLLAERTIRQIELHLKEVAKQ